MTSQGIEYSPEQLEEIYEQQASKVNSMGQHELIAYYSGFPPDDKCIATPESFREAIETGEIEVIFSPCSQADVQLSQLFGKREPMNLTGPFSNCVSQNDQPGTSPLPELTRDC